MLRILHIAQYMLCASQEYIVQYDPTPVLPL